MSILRILLISISLLASCNALAQWTGGVEAGTRLGSEERPTLRFFARNPSDPLSHFLFLDWVRDSGGSNFRLGYNPTYNISRSIFTFGRFSIERDDFDGIDQAADALIGIGNNLYQQGDTRVRVETGIGVQQREFNGGDSETDGFLFLGGQVISKIQDLLRFDVDIEAQLGDNQNTLEGEVGIAYPIAGGVALRYAYRVRRFELDGADDIVSEDNFFTLTYGF